jgi:molybdopterin molybdotransferase
MGPFAMAILASVGKSRVRVVRKPTVAILSTGDELVEIEAIPGASKIRNSNSSSLSAQVTRDGGIPVLLQTAPDEVSALKEQIRKGLEADVLLVSGGVSAGKYDLVEPVLTELGIKIHFESVSMRPGKPTVFATRDAKWVFGLPGNPVSTFVSYAMFVSPVLKTLQGLKYDTLPLIPAVLEAEIVEKSGRTSFLPAKLFRKGKGFAVQPVKWKGSADIFSAAEANGLIIIPLETKKVSRGEIVEVLVFEECNSQMEGVF